MTDQEPTTATPADTKADLLTLETEPFLRITGTYPVDGGQVETVELSMHLRDGDDLVDDPGADNGAPVRSWFTDLVTQVIAELRRPPTPRAIMVTGAAARSLFADRVKHAEGCTGDCGLSMPAAQASDGAEDAGTGDAAGGQ